MIEKAWENILILGQGMRLLHFIDDDVYCSDMEEVEASSVGAHMRHNLDHYSSFFVGIESGTVDYDLRERQKFLETDRQAALEMTHIICQRLAGLAEFRFSDMRISSYSHQGSLQVISSLNRELDFLLGHTIHHYAIIAMLCRLQNVDVEQGFGVAPSTLRYQRALVG